MPALRAATAAAERYLSTIDSDLIRRPGADAAAMSLGATLPEDGDGALVAIDELMRASDGALRNSGPRFFHWVVGGTTPAALAADWLTSTFDQNAFGMGLDPARHALRGARDRLAEAAVRPPRVVGRRAHHRRDDGQLHRARRRAPLVGAASRRRHRRARIRGSAGRAGALERLHPSQRDESACDARASDATPFAASCATTSVASISLRSRTRCVP